jgi:hypothetical protein
VQRQPDVARHLDRHVELVARAADVTHARGADAREAEVDLASRREGELLGTERGEGVGCAYAPVQGARVRPLSESTAVRVRSGR